MQMLAPFVAGLGLYSSHVHFLSTNLTPLAEPDAATAMSQIEAAA